MGLLSSIAGVLTVAFTTPLIAAATPPLAALAACEAIEARGIETQIVTQDFLHPDYIEAKTHYWSAANGDLTPACATFPINAGEVSTIVSILQRSTGVDFAVKSGGHNPNVGFSSVDGGVLISMSKLASTVLSLDKKTAVIGPGARWREVISALEPDGVTVVSGRLGDVGVAGLTLGGGLSFLSSQYGLVCDNVVNYEIVLADGSIVNANKTSNPDLFFSLKGGGNQFGIVTKFTMKTHPIGKVWGGIRSYAGTEAAALINATHDFTENFKDPKAAIIVTGEIAIDSLLQIFVVFFFYDGEKAPAGVFDKFELIPTITDGVKAQTYSELLIGNDVTNLDGLRYLIRGTTLPNFPSTTGRDLYNEHFSMWKKYVMTEGILHPDFIFSIAFQPLPFTIPSASVTSGGNALGLSPDVGDRMWMEYNISWLTAIGDKAAHRMAINITATIDEYAKGNYKGEVNSNWKGGDLEDGYKPIFLNDAMFDQKPLHSYPEANYKRLMATQKSVDPEGIFSGRQGGFKFA